MSHARRQPDASGVSRRAAKSAVTERSSQAGATRLPIIPTRMSLSIFGVCRRRFRRAPQPRRRARV